MRAQIINHVYLDTLAFHIVTLHILHV